MTVTTIYANNNDSWSNFSLVSFADCVAGTNAAAIGDPTVLTVLNTYDFEIDPTWTINKAFMTFDTSGIPSVDTILSVTLSLYAETVASNTSELRLYMCSSYTWYGSSTYLDSNRTSITAAQYNEWASSAALVNYINRTGDTRLAVESKNAHDSINTDSGNYTFSGYGHTGTSQDPKLTITHEAPPPAHLRPRLFRGRF